MVHRIVAFAVWKAGLRREPAARSYLDSLARPRGMTVHFESVGAFEVGLVLEGNVERLVRRATSESRLDFYVGLNRLEAASFPVGGVVRDRHLRVSVREREIECVTDYAGSVPVFYAWGGEPILSNLEPLVVLTTACSEQDLSLENLYGYLRFTHLIWEETLYQHLYSQLPDHTFRYRIGTGTPEANYNRTVQASDSRCGLSDRDVARQLFELNQELVEQALSPYDVVILPLSAGYDSRMILAAGARCDRLRRRLHCFTYGDAGTLEVEAARRLCERLKISWQRVTLPLQFLGRRYTEEVLRVFGSSLHAHGMYQLEFFDTIRPLLPRTGNVALTSGFMTGVPAGQHNSKLGIDSADPCLSAAMNRFSQSRYFPEAELLRRPVFKREMAELHENRFRRAFDLYAGRPRQKAVMFDVWTRQRNFIAYYPRTLEWRVPVVSPQMTPEYANFFQSLSDRHLNDRRAVELMFRYHYPEVADIASNSNGYSALTGRREQAMVMGARVLARMRCPRLIPQAYRNAPLSLDAPAMRQTGRESCFPLPEMPMPQRGWFQRLFPEPEIEGLIDRAIRGGETEYNRLAILQPVAFGLGLIAAHGGEPSRRCAE